MVKEKGQNAMKNRIEQNNELKRDDEMTPRIVASRIADLVVLFAEREVDWLAEHGYEFDINVYDAGGEAVAYAMIKPRTRMRLRVSEVQPSANGSHEKERSNTAPTCKKVPGRPFVNGNDPRRNLKGRPRTFDQARALAQSIAHERTTLFKGKLMTVAEKILREWAESKEPQLQKAFIEYCFGKVPDKLESTGLENKKTLILHYGHEFKRLERDRLLGDDNPPR